MNEGSSPVARSTDPPNGLGGAPRHAARVLRRGSWKKPEIRLVFTAEGMVVEKDYRVLSSLLAPWSRLLWRREERIHRALRGVESTPRLIRSSGGLLVMEFVSGEPISQLDGTGRGPAAVRALEQAVEELHRAGIYHLDMRKRDNVLVESDGRIRLVDFGSAVRLRPGRLAARLLSRLINVFDQYAVLKWKSTLDPDSMTASEWQLVRRMDSLRWRRRREAAA